MSELNGFLTHLLEVKIDDKDLCSEYIFFPRKIIEGIYYVVW